ncbi:sulfatase-like hydrolase/transferase [bacterium]|nr:sulfatase-like hydrolase/transferase [bacterium]
MNLITSQQLTVSVCVEDKKMRFAHFAAVCLALVCARGLGDERPHVVIVMADDHGYGDTGYTGHPFVQTPNLDAMAEGGVVFNRFYASAPVCSPTRASVMTGRHPFRTNVPNHGHYMRPHETTIAEVLKDAGYVTGHFGKWHIGSVQPDSPTSPGGAGFDEWLSGLNFFDNDPYLSRNGNYEQMKGAGTVISMDATIDFLTRHHAGEQPMFAVTWFPAPHDPQEELPDLPKASKLYSDENTKKPGYFREITLLDQQIGRLQQTLTDLGIRDNTLFLYCSDNGGLVQASSGGRAKKGSIYEGGLRVPAILQWPAKYQARQVDTPAFSSDIYPTILAVGQAKVEHQTPLDGINLDDVISGERTTRPGMGFWHGFRDGQGTWSDRIIKALMEAKLAGQPNPHPERILKNVNVFPELDSLDSRGHAAWNAWPWKLHRIENRGQVKYELYHLVNDPMETKDLSNQEPEHVRELTTALEAWQHSVLRSWSGADYRQ